jgi:CheY-like chemotaxis protein
LKKEITVVDHSLLKTTILLLVSDPLVRSVLEETLEHEGYTVRATGDIGQAVERLGESTPDLLITRTYVQSMLGHEAAKYLLTKCPTMRVLMVGGLLDDKRLRYRAELQGFEVFPKPYSAAELLQKVKDVLGKRRGWTGRDRDRDALANSRIGRICPAVIEAFRRILNTTDSPHILATARWPNGPVGCRRTSGVSSYQWGVVVLVWRTWSVGNLRRRFENWISDNWVAVRKWKSSIEHENDQRWSDVPRLLARLQNGEESHFGIRVWADHCSVITNVGAESPNLFGDLHKLPVNLSGTVGQHSLNNVIGEHMHRHPHSDLVAVLTGKKPFEEALG